MASHSPTRDAKGKFLPGNGGGPGRRPIAKEREFLDVLRQSVTLEGFGIAVAATLKRAQQGSIRHFEALCKHVLPQPKTLLQINALEDRNFEFRVGGSTPDEVQRELIADIKRRVQELQEREAGLRQGDTAAIVVPKKAASKAKKPRKPKATAVEPPDLPPRRPVVIDADLKRRVMMAIAAGVAKASIISTFGLTEGQFDRIADEIDKNQSE